MDLNSCASWEEEEEVPVLVLPVFMVCAGRAVVFLLLVSLFPLSRWIAKSDMRAELLLRFSSVCLSFTKG
jgi:hypothetical protein